MASSSNEDCLLINIVDSFEIVQYPCNSVPTGFPFVIENKVVGCILAYIELDNNIMDTEACCNVSI